MATAQEIEDRVEQADAARSATRAAAAQQVSALAERRAAIAEQLADIDDQLGDTLATASKVMSITELATFTDIPAADLTHWHTPGKPSRSKRKKPTTGTAATGNTTSRGPSTTKTSTPGQEPAPTEPAASRTAAAQAPARVPAEVS
ncbi:MAG: hypothetical protein JWQ81_956 [Amycolatopsis sp.]|uniref:hypothetical protein n=1 Tax=Amycolatopsis sp. TaxID=37632 RepID=UPI002616CFDA|nr:hypothetical protein [Amycolatopsis sp.]MCU1680217.1 hypothetical protein [Amycolatopsis sp.]